MLSDQALIPEVENIRGTCGNKVKGEQCVIKKRAVKIEYYALNVSQKP